MVLWVGVAIAGRRGYLHVSKSDRACTTETQAEALGVLTILLRKSNKSTVKMVE